MKNNIETRRAGSWLFRSVCFKLLLITFLSLFAGGLVWAQPKVDYDALRKNVREHPAAEAKSGQPKPSPDNKADRELYERSMAAARKAMAAGDYAKATDLATLLVQGWPGDAAAKELLAQAQKGTTAPATPPTQPAPDLSSTTAAPLAAPKATKHEIFVSGDFLLGQGTVTLPVGFGLKQSLNIPDFVPSALSADRSSTYYGGTVSYSYGQRWYVDLSYVHGESSGSQTIDAGWLGQLPTDFTITDEWFQAYVRYAFRSRPGNPWFAYLRAGASFVQADLSIIDALLPNGDIYNQKDKTQDVLGNFGFGLGYWLYRSPRMKLGLQFEGEGFYGTRSQKSLEELKQDTGLAVGTDNIDNTLYGGIGRVTMRLELPLGHSGLFKVFMDGGVQGRYTLITYPKISGSAPNELLWGPYVKLGLRYAF